MSEGIRIRPRRELGFPDAALIVVTDHARPIPPPKTGEHIEDVLPVCATCGIQHFAKAYHIQLRAGSAVVSSGVWDAFKGLADNPFEAVNPVPEPPALHINPTFGTQKLVEKVVMPIYSRN